MIPVERHQRVEKSGFVLLQIMNVHFYTFDNDIGLDMGAAHYSEDSLFRTHKFPIPGGSLIRKLNKVRLSEHLLQ